MREGLNRLAKDREHLDSGRLEDGLVMLQLNELRPAEGSPARRALEDDKGALAFAGLCKVDHIPVLIG